MDNDVITFLDDSEPITKTSKEESINPLIKDDKKINNEFINGLPDWDLEPPYEIIKRSNL